MEIRFLYYEDCPSHDVALDRLCQVMAEEGIQAEVEIIKVETDEQAQRLRFVGSPTILIEGRDIDPPPADAYYALTCRAYRLEDGRISPLPSPDMVRRALRAASSTFTDTKTYHKNVEIKARCADLDAARQIALELGASPHADVRQVDTYFAVPHGRLKLRQSTPHPTAGEAMHTLLAELIYYQRPDQHHPKTSDYEIVPIEDGELLRQVLAQALGVRAQVSKRREVFLLGNTRIHLDEVEGLGTFIEFEVVLEGGSSEAAGQERAGELIRAFGIGEPDLISGSYVDLCFC